MKIEFKISSLFKNKPTSLQLALLGVIFMVIFLSISTYLGKKALEEKGNLRDIKRFEVVSHWNSQDKNNVLNFIVSGNFVYVALEEGGIGILNRELKYITNIILQINNKKLNVKDIEIINFSATNYLLCFVPGLPGENGFAIFSISDPARPEFLKFHSIDFLIQNKFCTFSNMIYLLEGEKLKIFEFSPSNITEKGEFFVGIKESDKIIYRNGFFFIPAYNDGLYIGRFEKTGFKVYSIIKSEVSYVSSCDIYDNYLVISDKMLGVSLYNISEISQPRLIFRYDTPGDAFQVLMPSRNEIYVADGINGVFMLKFQKGEYHLEKIFKDSVIVKNIFYDDKNNKLYVAGGINGIYLLK